MNEQERRTTDADADKRAVAIVVGGVVSAGLVGGVIGYDLGQRSATKQEKPAVNNIYGNQINNNSINFNSDGAGGTGE